jgi:lincosamide nucleotidyltransferase A/C/D/E
LPVKKTGESSDSNEAKNRGVGGKMVSADEAAALYKSLSPRGLQVWVTGGWGIDALLGEQTRPHKDLDLIVLLDDVVQMCQTLSRAGFNLKELWSENHPDSDMHGVETATAFVLHHADGREIDIHAVRLDQRGVGVPAWEADEGFVFTRDDLAGKGIIAGFPVRCISPQKQMLCHTGYVLPGTQLHDLELLGKKFNLTFPVEDGSPPAPAA